MTPGRRLALNGLLMSAGSVAGGLLLFLVFVIVARYLGVKGLGDFVLILTATSLLQLFGDGGLVAITVRDIARDLPRQGEILAKSWGVLWGVSVPAVGVVVALTTLAAPAGGLRVAILLMGAGMLAALHGSLLVTVARAHEQMGILALFGVLHKALLMVLVLLVTRSDLGLPGVAAAHLGANLVQACAHYWLVRVRYTRPTVRLELSHARALLRDCLPLGAGVLLRKTNLHVCTLVLGLAVGAGAVGIYNSAYRFLQMIEVGSLTVSGVVLPALAKAHGPDLGRFNRLFSASTRALLLVSAPAAGLLMVTGDELILTVYGPEYASAGIVLRLLGVSLVALVPGALLNAAFTAARKQPLFMRLSALGVVLNTGGCLLLVPLAQSLGAALATFLTEAATLVVGTLWLSRVGVEARYFQSFLCTLAPTALAAVAAAGVRFALGPGLSVGVGLLAVWGVYGACYAALVVMLRSVTAEELTLLLGRSPGPRFRAS